MNLTIRDITAPDEMRAVEQLQKDAWDIDDREVVPATQLIAAVAAGGQLIGAWEDGALVGFVYGFVGLFDGRIAHHSHLLAVRPDVRDHDIGYRLKLFQRERVLAQGIDEINWTFDPLQSRNAHLNFRKLGVTSDCYKIDFYGLGTDRLWVTWSLLSERNSRASKPSGPVLIDVDANGAPRQRAFDFSGEHALIAIPRNINALSPALASQSREATRRAFVAALAEGFVVNDFIDGMYVLSRRKDRA